ncbi:hypothetical protein OAU26_03740 [Mariniblastus sp.]|nr:hypothetical protein [Mariniblastus sp.]
MMAVQRQSHKRLKRKKRKRPGRLNVFTGLLFKIALASPIIIIQIITLTKDNFSENMAAPAVTNMHAAYEVSEATLCAEMQRAGGPSGDLDQQHKRVSPFLTQMLEEMMTCEPQETYDLTEENLSEMRSSIEICSRAHDNMYLTEAVQPHRSCSNGDGCESVKVGGFVLREFLLPSQHAAWVTDGVLPTTPGECVFCQKYIVVLKTYRQSVRYVFNV